MHQAPEVTVDGYSALHFLVIYWLGMYLSTAKRTQLGGEFYSVLRVDGADACYQSAFPSVCSCFLHAL